MDKNHTPKPEHDALSIIQPAIDVEYLEARKANSEPSYPFIVEPNNKSTESSRYSHLDKQIEPLRSSPAKFLVELQTHQQPESSRHRQIDPMKAKKWCFGDSFLPPFLPSLRKYPLNTWGFYNGIPQTRTNSIQNHQTGYSINKSLGNMCSLNDDPIYHESTHQSSQCYVAGFGRSIYPQTPMGPRQHYSTNKNPQQRPPRNMGLLQHSLKVMRAHQYPPNVMGLFQRPLKAMGPHQCPPRTMGLQAHLYAPMIHYYQPIAIYQQPFASFGFAQLKKRVHPKSADQELSDKRDRQSKKNKNSKSQARDNEPSFLEPTNEVLEYPEAIVKVVIKTNEGKKSDHLTQKKCCSRS